MDNQQNTQEPLTVTTDTSTVTAPLTTSENAVLTSDNLQNPVTPPQTSSTHVEGPGRSESAEGECNCICHAEAKPLDEELWASSCYHCKPQAHPLPQQAKQEKHPNLNAGNNNEDNKWAQKWKTAEERIIACEKYCEYIRRGRSKKYYPDADPKTIQRYIDEFPEEFRPEKIADAERAGMAYIESIGFKGMTGGIKGFNATTWIWITKNKLNWRDKVQVAEGSFDDLDAEWEPDGE